MKRLWSDAPDGFRYREELISPEDEASLLERIRPLPLQHFEFRGRLGRRRVISFGWRYSFTEHALQRADPIPDFLLGVRERAAAFAGLAPDTLEQSSVIEYSPGTPIGWHRDKPVFGEVVGVSLLSACTFRFRRTSGSGWIRHALTVEPRSVYLLRGPARSEWEHSIPEVPALRYSITFRTMS